MSKSLDAWRSEAEPELVVCVHAFGNLLNFHPHLHVMATDGGFTPEGVFHPLPTMIPAPIEDLFRQRAFEMLPGTNPPPATPAASPAPVELEYLPWVE